MADLNFWRTHLRTTHPELTHWQNLQEAAHLTEWEKTFEQIAILENILGIPSSAGYNYPDFKALKARLANLRGVSAARIRKVGIDAWNAPSNLNPL